MPHADTSEEDAAKDRFRVVQRHDVRFTMVQEEVDTAAGVFLSKANLRNILRDNPAATFYVQYYPEHAVNRPTVIVEATAAFLKIANSKHETPPDRGS